MASSRFRVLLLPCVALAAAFATASDTARIAFAPSRLFVGVASSAIIAASTSACRVASRPSTAGPSWSFTCSTARSTPRPW